VSRRLMWPMCRNVRDLGGLAIGRDHQVQARALVRSDNLDQLDETGVAAVRSADVSRIVDLRSVWECQTFPSPFADDPIWMNVWLNGAGEPDDSRLPLAQQYCNALDRQQDRVAAAIAAIAEAPPGCVVVACHAGKDRTGVVIALALHLLGVSDRVIAEDYAVHGDEGMTEETLLGELDSEVQSELMPPQSETMLATLDYVRFQYGSIRAYLAAGGLTTNQLDSLTSRLRMPVVDDL
jgi:protein-tyrosine phosphatase